MKSLSERQVRTRQEARALLLQRKMNWIYIYHNLIFLPPLATVKRKRFLSLEIKQTTTA